MNVGLLIALSVLGPTGSNLNLAERSQALPNDNAAQTISDEEIVKLIGALQSYSSADAGINAVPWYREFIPLEKLYKLYTKNESEELIVFPPLRKLVQLGTRALPKLIEHLSDDRDTELSVDASNNGLGGLNVSVYYDSRFHDSDRLPKGVIERKGLGGTAGPVVIRHLMTYTVKVGDLCYIAIGQIVNRSLWLFDSYSNGSGSFLSPIESPSLALAVKKDWGGLTKDEHAKQLELDSYVWPSLGAYGSSPMGYEAAIRRIAYYLS